MKGGTGLVLVVAMVLGIAGSAPADGPDHVGIGVIVATDPSRGTLKVLLHGSKPWALMVNETTRVYDELGREILEARLTTGDYVREVCGRLATGEFTAKQINVLRPAWRQMRPLSPVRPPGLCHRRRSGTDRQTGRWPRTPRFQRAPGSSAPCRDMDR